MARPATSSRVLLPLRRGVRATLLVSLLTGTPPACTPATPAGLARLLVAGESRTLSHPAEQPPVAAPRRSTLLVLALDGIDRTLLYPMLRDGKLPALARLLGQEGSRFPHAYFDESIVATLPSSTGAAWVAEFTGAPPAVNGITGNEFFVRETRELAAPIPGAVDDPAPSMASFSDDYLDELALVPGIYQRMHERDPTTRIWSAMQLFHAGADRLLLSPRAGVVEAFQAMVADQLTKHFTQDQAREFFESVDRHAIESVEDALKRDAVPDVLTVYLPGTDQLAHVAESGPDAARYQYLMEVTDPLLARLANALSARGALTDRYVVVLGDHGHTPVRADDAHALGTDGKREPPEVLRRAGFRVRPFAWKVADDDPFQSVLTYQGAMAFVYLADRSTCPRAGDPCDWNQPARWREDVIPAAEAFHRSSARGSPVPALRGTLDLVLTRHPRPIAEVDLPFDVYVGAGKLVPVPAYLKAHPHPTYLQLDARLRDLGVGPAGERAGDIVLLAHDGDRASADQRFYFGKPLHSHHGSPSARDSDITLIVAHPGHGTAEIGRLVKRTIGEHPRQQAVGELLLALRFDPP